MSTSISEIFRLLNFLQNSRVQFAAGMGNFVARLVLDAVRELHAQQVGSFFAVGVERPEELLVFDGDAIDGVERAENVFTGTQTKRAQKDRSQELALAVDADVEDVLLVVFEFHPRAAVGNDLAQEICAVVGGLEEYAGRAVQLADDDALGTINNEGSVLRHQRNVAEEYFLLFNVADGAVASLGVLIENRQTHRDFERSGVGHAALFALGHVIFQLQSNRVAALVAEIRRVGVVGAALLAQHVAGMKRVSDDRVSAILTSGTQMV